MIKGSGTATGNPERRKRRGTLPWGIGSRSYEKKREKREGGGKKKKDRREKTKMREPIRKKNDQSPRVSAGNLECSSKKV